ncbi:MAG: DUF4157 domain-containing protein [Bacteroidota bacterium]
MFQKKSNIQKTNLERDISTKTNNNYINSQTKSFLPPTNNVNFTIQKKEDENYNPQQDTESNNISTQLKSYSAPNNSINFTVQKKANNTGLPDNLKSGIENLSGHSMDDVKLHYNSSQPAQLNAHAYAQGNQIHIAPGQQKHLAHEAWHVVQQKQGRVKPTKQLKSSVAINDDISLEKEADVMGAKARSYANTRILELSHASMQAKQNVQRVGVNSNSVAQLVKIKLVFRDLATVNTKEKTELFKTYLLSIGCTYDEKGREIDTGVQELSKEIIMTGFVKYASENTEPEAPRISPEELQREQIKLGVETIQQRFSKFKIARLAEEGKNNLGIYEIEQPEGNLVIKILNKGFGSLESVKNDTTTIKDHFDPIQTGIKLSIVNLLHYDIIEQGPVKVALAIFKKHGVMSLGKALEHQDLDTTTLVAAARGLAVRIAAFHFAPIHRNDISPGKYLAHGDLNVSNIVLSLDGIAGLVDNDGLKPTNDIRLVIHDVGVLLIDIREALKRRYGPRMGMIIYAQMKTGFLHGYEQEMNTINVPETSKIMGDIVNHLR